MGLIKTTDVFRIQGKHHFIFQDVFTGEIRKSIYENLIVNVCKNMIAQRLAGDGNNCNITYGAVGTGAGVPAAGDTTISTEFARKLVAAISDSANVVSITTFFGASEANGALTRFGLFGEAASATPNSGTLICHVIISETKTPSETLTIESTITIS